MMELYLMYRNFAAYAGSCLLFWSNASTPPLKMKQNTLAWTAWSVYQTTSACPWHHRILFQTGSSSRGISSLVCVVIKMAPCPGMWARSFLLLPLVLGVVRSSKLNVPRVLLPYASTPPSFPLLSESGCYTWSSTRPEVVQVKPDLVGCSSSAVSIFIIK